jgi:hypothetical protein
MTIAASDLKFFQSDVEGSSGGSMSLIEIPQGQVELIFRDTPRQFLVDGGIVYKKIFAINVNPDFALLAAKAFTLLQPTSGERLALALGIGNDVDPLPLEFQEYSTYEAGLDLGSLTSNVPVPIWMRRLTPAGMVFNEDITSFFQLAVKGLSS